MIPRGIDLSLITPHHADSVATILNNHDAAASTTSHPPPSTMP